MVTPIPRAPIEASFQRTIYARTDISPDSRLHLYDGSRWVEDVRTSRVDKGPEQHHMILAEKSKNGAPNRSKLDISWLSAAAETYDLSPDPRDYVFVSIPIVTAGVPNRNADCFTYEELTSFNYMTGRLGFRNFVGAMTCIDHVNRDPKKDSKGIHFDASMSKVLVSPGGVGYAGSYPKVPLWKVRVLTGWSRSKDPRLVADILKRIRTAYSMGATVGYAVCSLPKCRKYTTIKGAGRCPHIKGRKDKSPSNKKGKLVDGYVCYDEVYATNFFETSNLGVDPADVDAFETNSIIDPSGMRRSASAKKPFVLDDLWVWGREAA